MSKSIDETQYLKEPHKCPFCGSDEVDSTGPAESMCLSSLFEPIQCGQCGKRWEDEYTLKAVKEIRTCDECHSAMSSGFVVDDGEKYYCTDKCLHKHYTAEQWAEMTEDINPQDKAFGGGNYWTEWESEYVDD
jgi:hypothetical protein